MEIRGNPVLIYGQPAQLANYHRHAMLGDTLYSFATLATSIREVPQRQDEREGPFRRFIDFSSMRNARYLYSIRADSALLPLPESGIMGFGPGIVYGRNYEGEFEAWKILLR